MQWRCHNKKGGWPFVRPDKFVARTRYSGDLSQPLQKKKRKKIYYKKTVDKNIAQWVDIFYGGACNLIFANPVISRYSLSLIFFWKARNNYKKFDVIGGRVPVIKKICKIAFKLCGIFRKHQFYEILISNSFLSKLFVPICTFIVLMSSII